MINFTIGPVQSPEVVKRIGADDVPYFRTTEFSEVMLENEQMILKLANAPEGSRAVFITGSGTASMEASIMNALSESDRAIVVNGGSFGARFGKLCEIHHIPFDEIKLDYGSQLRKCDIERVATGRQHTAFVVNRHETSTGLYYDMGMISDYCKKNDLFLIVDNISSFLCDEFDMAGLGADVMIAGSQKGLACPPGISVIILSPRALERVAANTPQTMYFDLKAALSNQERGQTPFTPAVGILLQINARLHEIEINGGVDVEIRKAKDRAGYFRDQIRELPLEIASESLGNAVTPLRPTNGMSAYDIFLRLKDEYGMWICPNGGELKERIFRVGHMGCLSLPDYDRLVRALKEVMS